MNSMSKHPQSGKRQHVFTDLQSTDSSDQRSEEVHIRNFDVERTYSLTLTLRDEDGLVFANRYHLKPGKAVSELDRLPPGKYVVHAKLNGRRHEFAVCEINESPAKTVLVELGNGTVSVTEGLYN
jgi:hypothetical protein